MKKVLCLLLAIVTVLSLVACGGNVEDSSSTDNVATTEGTNATTVGTQGTEATTDATTTNSEETTGTGGPIDPVVESYGYTIIDVGEYAQVWVRPGICDVKADVNKGLGSKETLTLTVTLAPGFVFDGWTLTNSIANSKDKLNGSTETYDKVLVTDTTYEITVSEDIIPDGRDRILIVPNYSYTVTYYTNDGLSKDGKTTYVQKYPAVAYNCAVTLPEQGFFSRDGYTLVEYNTKADGTGYGVSLGSRMPMGGKPTVELYCIWVKQNDASEFTYTTSGSSAVITGYNGTATTVVIPDMIDGKEVKSISTFTTKTPVTEVILSKNVVSVEKKAFTSLKTLESLVMYDCITKISDTAFAQGALKHLRVNASLNLFSGWQQVQSTIKLDRVVDAAYSGKKLFFIYGGSGAHNGLDCVQIDDALKGEYYIVNVGSNAQCSAAYYFDWFEDLVDGDDVILWMPECGNWMLGDTRFHDRLWEINAGYYDSLRYVDISKFTQVFDSYQTYANSYHASQQCSYDTFWKSGDTYGDNAGVRASAGKTYYYDLDAAGRWDISLETYTHQAELIAKMKEQGNKMLFTFPAMDESGGGISQQSLEYYRDDVLEAFPGLECISGWETPLVPNKMMYDSEWHLTLDGAIYRTSKLVPDIVNALK
ncbi:MAG: hypothetical protein MJ236_02205 [Clostridia bacterium]|nr:hypothetical protein [Clostridia bacterium]